MNLNSISNHYLGWQWPILPSSCLSDAGTLQGKAVPAPWGSRQHYQPLPWWNDDFHYWGIEKSSRSSLQKDLQRFNTTLTNEKTNKKHKLGRGMKKKPPRNFHRNQLYIDSMYQLSMINCDHWKLYHICWQQVPISSGFLPFHPIYCKTCYPEISQRVKRQ